MSNPYYTDYSEYLAGIFGDRKVQKLSVNAGFTCPNRNGDIGTGGCIYCNNASFSPSYTMQGHSVRQQIEAGRRFFARKYPEMRYLVYFQSFTNTYGERSDLLQMFAEAMHSADDVVGIIIGTRPDTVDADLIAGLAELNRHKRVIVEYGAESSHDQTLARINRGHTWQTTCRAVRMTAEAGLSCGLHLIAGLPGETRLDIIETVRRAAMLPIDTIKLHQMQVIEGTALHRLWTEGRADLWQFTLNEYLDLCAEVTRIVPRRIAIERFLSQAPPEMLVYPRWGLKNYEFVNLLHALLSERQ